jgi:Ca2+-binding RTX toxin-like protein
MAKFKGSDNNDLFYGTEDDDVMRGRGGSDGLNGRDGDDRLFGGDGIDYLRGGAGSDFLSGGDGDDYAYFGDALAGPALTQGLRINLATGVIANDGYGNRETIRSVESIFIAQAYDFTSPYLDRLRGDAANNSFHGLGDRDQVRGGAGDDIFVFYGASDAVIGGGTGRDALYLEGTRYVVDPDTGELVEEKAKEGIVIDLARGLIENDGFGGHSGRVTGMENVIGAALADHLTGNDSDNTLSGDGGDDVLIGGRGRDNLSGQTGRDTYVFALGDSGKTEETADVIGLFQQRLHEVIDLSAISREIGHTLTFIGQRAFSGAIGEVRYDIDPSENGHSLIEIDVTGDGETDMAIATGYGSPVDFGSSDFLF